MPTRTITLSTIIQVAVRHKKLLGVVGSVIGVFIFLNYVLLPLYVSHGSTIMVPSVVGMTLSDAEQMLRTNDLEAVGADTLPDPRIPMGSVISQNPQPEAVVKHGRRIYLTISGGEPMASVPQLRGRSPRDAKFTLERSGLTLGKTAYATSELYPENTIVDQSIEQGTNVAKGTPVDILVSQGKALTLAAVPDVVGKTVTEADRLLSQRGLKLGNIAYQSSLDLLPNTIVDQFPRAGDSVAVGRAIDLFVIKAGRPKEEIEPLKK